MRRSHFPFALLATILLGCSFFSNAFQGGTAEPGDTEKTAGISQPDATDDTGGAILPTATVEPEGAALPTAKPAIPKATNTSCNELSFFLAANLAKAAKCETIPASGGAGSTPFETYPMYTKVTLTSYTLGTRMMQPVISVFSVERYAEMLPDVVDPDVTALQALIAGGSSGSEDMPILPVLNARQLFLAQTALLSFQNGSGIGFITQYAQAYVPINNHDMFFAFQGLTSDGAYWVSVILPITHPSLWETAGDPSNTIYSTINDNPDAYYTKMAAEINGVAPRSFVPILSSLIDLVGSIIVKA
jgi:hypothetical protein